MQRKIRTRISIGLLALLIMIGSNALAVSQTIKWTANETIGLALGNVILLASMAFLYGLCRLYPRLQNLPDDRIKRHYKISFWLLGGLMFIVPFFFMIDPNTSLHRWDFFMIFQTTSHLAGRPFGTVYDTPMSYFLRYPNNQFLGIVINGIFAPFAHHAWLKTVMMTGLSSLLTALGLLSTSRLVKLLKNERMATFFNVAALGFLPFYFYGAQLYTDTLTLPFVAASSLFFVKAYQAKARKQQLGWSLLACALVVLGYLFKPTVAIVLLAALVFLVINRKWKKCLALLLIFLALFGIGRQVNQAVIATQPGFHAAAQYRYNFPMMHWIMMSWDPQNSTGGFNLKLRQYTQSIPGKTAKNQAVSRRFWQNLQQMGPSGILRQIGRKLAYTWALPDLNSTFYTYAHVNPLLNRFFDYLPMGPDKGSGNFVGWFMLKVSQMLYWLPIVLLLWKEILVQLVHPKRWGHLESFPMITVFGLSMFLILWEANTRYLYSFAPLILVIALGGFGKIFDRKMKRENE